MAWRLDIADPPNVKLKQAKQAVIEIVFAIWLPERLLRVIRFYLPPEVPEV